MSEGSEAILRVSGLARSFGGVQAVADASFEVSRGTLTALIGPNGAGKTTAFNLISGFARADAGDVLFDGRSISRRQPHQIARRGLVRTFQTAKALAAMSVIDNMMLAATEQPGERLPTMLLTPRAALRRERAIRDRARELLDRFGLADKEPDYAGTLSGGQRKLLELARALMTEPKLLLLDEPMAGINPSLGLRILELIRGRCSDDRTTFLFIEHDMDAVMSHADHVVVMAEGRTIASGPPDAVRSDPSVIDAYLGGAQA